MVNLVLLVSVLKVGDGVECRGCLRPLNPQDLLRPKVMGLRKVLGCPGNLASPGLKVKG